MYLQLDYTIICVHLIGSMGCSDLKQQGTNKPFGSAKTMVIKANYLCLPDFTRVELADLLT